MSAVLFDLFGTLVPSPPKDGYREVVDGIASVARLPKDEFFDKWMSVNDGRLSGSFGSSQGEIAHVVSMFDVSLSDSEMQACVRLRRNAMANWLTPKKGTLEVLVDLSRHGYSLALVSDCVFDVPAVWPSTPLSKLISVAVFSCQLGVRKPDPRIYQEALKRLDISPANALFVGDGGSNELAGAQDLGIRALLLDDQPADQSTVLRVDVHAWDGPSINNLSDVLGIASATSDS